MTDKKTPRSAGPGLSISSEDAFRIFIASVKDYAIFLLDADGRVATWNPGAERLKGYTAEEVIGKHFSIFYSEADRKNGKPADELRRAAAEGSFAEDGWRVRKDGSLFHAQMVLTALRDEAGVLRGFGKVTRDMTEVERLRRRAERLDVTESEERIRSVVNNVIDGIITIDHQGAVESLNPAAERTFGYAASELLGKNVKVLMPEPYHSEHDSYLSNYLGTGRPKIIGIGREVIGRRRDGSTFPMDLAVSEFRVGDRRFFTGIVRDITERKRLERELRQRVEQLAEADRRKDEFLALLGHELRNPLAPIRMSVELLRRRGKDRPELGRATDVIDRQAEHLNRLVDDLLEVSRITSGKIRIVREPTDATTIVARAVETTRPAIDAKRHKLTVLVPPEPLHVEADVTRMAQVLGNLLNNSAKYTDEGGHIWLTVEEEDGECVFRVRDNGMGIAPELLERVFDPFTQADRSLDRSQGGLGVGLTLVRSLVQMHGGSVAASSEGLGKGSQFTVRIPALVRENAAGMPAAQEVASTAPAVSRRILVVDDNHDATDTLREFLVLQGHDVRTAYDGPTALEAAERFPVEFVLLDIGLPGMNGYEVARRLRNVPGLADVILIALTGYGQERDRALSKEAGFDHHLVKPVDLIALEKLLGQENVPRRRAA